MRTNQQTKRTREQYIIEINKSNKLKSTDQKIVR